MTRKALRLAAILLALAPSVAISGMAAAQSALPDPAVPGSGYQVPQPTGVATAATSALADPAVPGSGYQVQQPTGVAATMTSALGDPAVPGDGYRTPSR